MNIRTKQYRTWFQNNQLLWGLILGWLRGRESSLVAPFLAHGLFWMMGAFMVIPG
jgi:membrane protease YdiL (CAAX protease family)